MTLPRNERAERVFAMAFERARDAGESFVVYLCGVASIFCESQGQAQAHARYIVGNGHAKREQVRIKRISLSAAKLPGPRL